MDQAPLGAFLHALREEKKGPFYASTKDLERFAAFVDQLPPADRFPLFIHCYDRYRSLSICGDLAAADEFERSCYSILISTILSGRIQPNQAEAIAILRGSYHRCGHGCDVDPPLTLAERAFRNQPYSTALFDGVLAYRETLRGTRSTHANNVKRKLSWVLWHDPRRFEKNCHTRRIQQAIHSMDPKRAFQWQWLLRNTAAGLNAAPGKAWQKEGGRRLALLGTEEFLARTDEWFRFSEREVNLSAPGSTMLRLLVWYGSLADPQRSLPIFARLAHVSWSKRAAAGKVIAPFAWLLRTYGGMKFEAEAKLICEKWARTSGYEAPGGALFSRASRDSKAS